MTKVWMRSRSPAGAFTLSDGVAVDIGPDGLVLVPIDSALAAFRSGFEPENLPAVETAPASSQQTTADAAQPDAN